jgi:hypothetical protein
MGRTFARTLTSFASGVPRSSTDGARRRALDAARTVGDRGVRAASSGSPATGDPLAFLRVAAARPPGSAGLRAIVPERTLLREPGVS